MRLNLGSCKAHLCLLHPPCLYYSAPPATALARALEKIQFKLAVLVYRCLHGTAPSYLADEFQCMADFEALRRLHSTSSLSLTVRCTQLSTVGDRAFTVTAAHTLPPRHFHTLCVCCPRSPQCFPFQAFLPMTFTATFVVPAQRQLSFLNLNRSLYLLTYLLIMLYPLICALSVIISRPQSIWWM